MNVHSSVDGTHQGITTLPQKDIPPSTTIQSPGYAIDNGSIGVTINPWMGYLGDGITAISAMPDNPVLAAAIELLGIGVTANTETMSASYNACFSFSGSTFNGAPAGVTPSPSNESNWTMTPVYNIMYSPHMVISDQWGASGYTGQAFTTLYQFNGSQYFSGNFAWNGNGGGNQL